MKKRKKKTQKKDTAPLNLLVPESWFVFQPEGFYHATLNIGDTVAVALQKKLPTLMAEKLMYDGV